MGTRTSEIKAWFEGMYGEVPHFTKIIHTTDNYTTKLAVASKSHRVSVDVTFDENDKIVTASVDRYAAM